MHDLMLVLQTLKFTKLRTALLSVTVIFAFFTLGVLGTLRYSLDSGEASISERRLIVTHKDGLLQTLPISYLKRMEALDEVQAISHATWIGAYYKEARNTMMSFAVDPETWLESHPDMELSTASSKAFLNNKNGILASEALVAKYGWEVSQALPLNSVIYLNSDGKNSWPFILSGTFKTSAAGGGRNYIIAHYDYFNENRSLWKDTVGTYVVVPKSNVSADSLSEKIDTLFVGSNAPTSSTTDKAFHSAFFKQFGDLVLIIKLVVAITFFSLILVVTSGLALSIRQRSKEVGVLRVIGYSNLKIYRMIFLEAFILIGVSALIGLACSIMFNSYITSKLPQILPDIVLPFAVLRESLIVILVVVFFTVLIPATIALRVRPVEAFVMDS